MYQSEDGRNHQANLIFSIRVSHMEVTDCVSEVASYTFGYVSHSFNQFLIVDKDANLVAFDHGNAYPRSIVLGKYVTKAGNEIFHNDYDYLT